MGTRQAKRERRNIKKAHVFLIRNFLQRIHQWPYSYRWKLAIQILTRMKKPNNPFHPPRVKKDSIGIIIGDKVMSSFYPEERHIVRTVTMVTPYQDTPSKRLISTDGGEKCPKCKLQGHHIMEVDASWIVRIRPNYDYKKDPIVSKEEKNNE